jgi:hypothetical protein
MPLRQPRRAGLLLATGQLTQYSSELDDGYYKKGLAKSYTILTLGQYSGTVNIDLTYLVSTTAAFTGTTHTITDTGKCGVFKAAGGETIVISGANNPANNGTFTSASATADTLVLTAGLTDEAAGASVTFKKRGALSNNCVQDNHTGLMWARYCSVLQGVLGTGLMPWTGTSYDIFAFCAAANAALLGGYSDWRIPNIFELYSLSTCEQPNGAPNTTAFPGWPNSISVFIWSSTTDPYVGYTTAALALISGDAGIARQSIKTNNWYCALVRG